MATITLSNATISAGAPSGSVIGTFNVSGLQVLQTNPKVNYFSISGRYLIGKWTSPPTPGVYKVWVYVVNLQPAAFNITITAAAAQPTPTSITLTPATVSVPDNSTAGLLLSNIAVKMSDNSAFAGTLTLPQNALVVVSGSSMVLKRALVAGDDGAHQYTVTAIQNGASASATLALTVTAVAPTISPDGTMSAAPNGAALTTADGKWTWGASASGRPGEYFIVLNGTPTVGIGSAMEVANGGQLYVNTVNYGWYVWASGGFSKSPAPGPAVPSSVTLTPASVSLPDNSPTGATVSTIAVAMSDGSAFAGTLAISANNMVSISGTKAVLSRALSASDDGTKSYTITATQGGNSQTATLALTVAPPVARTLTLSLSSPPQIPDNSPSGTLVSTATVKYSDGTQPAAVTLTSSDTTFIKVQGMQLVLARTLTAADDGTHPVTITASDGLGVHATASLFGGTKAWTGTTG